MPYTPCAQNKLLKITQLLSTEQRSKPRQSGSRALSRKNTETVYHVTFSVLVLYSKSGLTENEMYILKIPQKQKTPTGFFWLEDL